MTMKIGILTFHSALNVGAVLQAYALQTFLKELGNDVEIVNYHNKEVDRYYELFGYYTFPKRQPIECIKVLRRSLYRLPYFRRFRKEVKTLLNVSPRIRNLEDEQMKKYDVIVIGSDQLWNKIITRGNDPFYWGEFTKYTHKPAITYAICMNAEHISDDEEAYIKSNLRNFYKISVREKSLADYIKKVSNLEAYVSLDPTLMIDESTWSRFAKKDDPSSEPYVCVYPVLDRERVINYAKDFAQRVGLRLVVLYPIAEIEPQMDYTVLQTPSYFLNTIANATYVITSSFHGLAFSVVFKREVYVIGDSGKNVRMKSLLDSLGMGERFVTDLSGSFTNRLNYTEIDKKLKTLRTVSQNYLIDTIAEINNM